MAKDYRIVERGGCVLVEGGFPLDLMASLTKRLPRGAVMDPDVARLAGAALAMGLPADLEALRRELAAEALAKAEADPALAGLSPEARAWLAAGRQGLSSATLFLRATGVRPSVLRQREEAFHPHDPADLNRCLMLLDAVPEARANFAAVRDLSPEWAALADAWDELRTLFHEEAGPDWSKAKSAPRTYERMKAVLASAAPSPRA